MRDCKNCPHYVLTDVKYRYGEEDEKIFGCELWECERDSEGSEEKRASE